MDQQIFRPNALRRFISTTLSELNPSYSLQGTTLEYYTMAFQNFIMPRICYAYFDIVNDCSEKFQYWPEALKMDMFMEQAWKENYENDIVSNFLYKL